MESAIIAYCLVAIVQHDMKFKQPTFKVLQVLSISLMDKIPLADFFERTGFNNVKELDCPIFPGVFIGAFIESGAENPYFFGTIIIDCSKDNCLSLIDGQQRTTTFLLLLKAISLCIKKSLRVMPESDDTRALRRGLNNSYEKIFRILYKADEDKFEDIERDWNNAKGIVVLENRSINELYKNDFQAIIEAANFNIAENSVYKIPRKQKDNKYTNFFRNFKYFYNNLSSYSESQLNNFAKIFLSKCQIIEIKSWQIEQAITMFNSLNSTGMPLSDADIISAQLYSKADNKDLFIEQWQRINEKAEILCQKK